MKNIIIMSPTYRRAVQTWERFQKIPKIWISATKNPLTLTLFNGAKFSFIGETESQRGLRCREIEYIIDEDVWEEMENEKRFGQNLP